MPRLAVCRRLTAGLSVTALALALAGCGDDGPEAPRSPATADSSGVAQPSGSASAPAGPPVSVFYVGDTPQGPRLFRDSVAASDTDELRAAADAVTDGTPSDPDYRTLWPGGTFAAVAADDRAITVELPDDSWLEPGALNPKQAALAVQQLVHTLHGVVGKALPVQVELGGNPATRLLGVDIAAGLEAAPELDVLGLVNVTAPVEGGGVSKTFTATGWASSFEGTVPWAIEDEAGTEVLQGFSTTEGWMDRLYPWRAEVDVSSLTPGTYTFVARTDDPSGGEGGGPTEDTKRITIE
ncbi:GerMN domain-containing protein [Nocardioides sp. zg-536]|uniref:GerMN domain-containing protein n=1 Tax=Nocardioides faecalis TaxID=2803858 RepID=A0A938Y6W7_9ACTN|nr:Gmad2 immunoglobulin-like domain-containing protein [Nocardioides faecalis]MBM9460304.1 GerMN domain-containing protein [Nocardioides faecalis]QVI59862.1 GerMN domain-containing protein [Nocardioides faecalis]